MGLVRLARRHWIAMLVILLLTMATGYEFRHSSPVYQTTGTILFSATQPGNSGTAVVSGDDLIITGDVVVTSVMSQAGAQAVRQAGGTGDYQFALVNFYNQQYPSYQEPAALLQASSPDPTVAERTFTAALAVVQQTLQGKQVAALTPPDALISASVKGGSTGPVPQTGYPKRTYGGLLLLAIIAGYCVATALDRHPGWAALPLRIRSRIWARSRIPARQ